MTMVRKAGTADVMLVQSMCPASPIIMAPTRTKTGAVVTGGSACEGDRVMHVYLDRVHVNADLRINPPEGRYSGQLGDLLSVT